MVEVLKNHEGDQTSAESMALDQLAQVQQQEHWLSVSCYVDGNNKVFVRETSWEMPLEAYPKIMEILATMVAAKQSSVPVPAPLPEITLDDAKSSTLGGGC